MSTEVRTHGNYEREVIGGLNSGSMLLDIELGIALKKGVVAADTLLISTSIEVIIGMQVKQQSSELASSPLSSLV